MVLMGRSVSQAPLEDPPVVPDRPDLVLAPDPRGHERKELPGDGRPAPEGFLSDPVQRVQWSLDLVRVR